MAQNKAYIFFHIILMVVHQNVAYQQFQSLIPNGAMVTDPCNKHASWPGVGHRTREGKTARNPFGLDFSRHNKVWKDICRLDSDADGLTNGEELGDPDCEWVVGAVPRGPAQSHPGICEPLSSPACWSKNDWLNCTAADRITCANIGSNTTFSKDLRLNSTTVPARETIYFCQMFDLNVTSDLHMIATEPLLTATNVVHHILLFGCDPRAELEAELRSPYPCVMVPHDGCRSLIGAWTVGSPGECAHPEMGFRVGPQGYQTVAIQVHWNNPLHLKDIIDTSGLRIHLTTSLRKYDAGMLVVGQQYLQIEPDTEDSRGLSHDVMFSATCPERCTKVMFQRPIQVTSAVNHMHYLGKSQEIKVYRNNSLINTITDQHNYNYDDPLIHNFPKPIEINPGDEIRTTCVYKRPTAGSPVCWGEATSDEMCFGFITYYPLQSLSHPWCTSMRSFPSCDRHLPSLGRHPFSGCRWWEFRNANHSDTRKFMGQVFDKCYPGREGLKCTRECQAVTRAVADHPCLQGDIGSYMIDKFKASGTTGQDFLKAIITCTCKDFPYCDRKTTYGLLERRSSELCSSAADSQRAYFWTACITTIILLACL